MPRAETQAPQSALLKHQKIEQLGLALDGSRKEWVLAFLSSKWELGPESGIFIHFTSNFFVFDVRFDRGFDNNKTYANQL